jgi:hypothetical protein
MFDLSYNPKLTFKNTTEFIIKDTSNYLGFSNNKINIYQPLDLSANGIIKFGNSLQIKDGSLNVVTINSTDIDTSANINLLNDNPEVTFRNGKELLIKDSSSYIGFSNNEINIYQPLDLSANGIIKFGTNIQIKDGTSTVVTIKSTDIDTSANINFLNIAPEITFRNDTEFKIKDTTNTYIGFDDDINIYQPLDLSPNGIIKFGSNLQVKDGSQNVITINSIDIDTSANLNLLNGTPEITYNNQLKFINNTYADNSSNPIIIYNTSGNNYEKKYLQKVTLPKDTSSNIYLKNIIETNDDTLTFTGKIASYYKQNTNTRYSANFLFDGYSRDTADPGIVNTIFFNLNTLYSDDSTNKWTINNITLSGKDLVIEIYGDSNKETHWIISVESVSI